MHSTAERDARDQWARALKPGDEVAVPGRYFGHPPYAILKVAKLTATQIVTTEDRRFALKDLYEIGVPRGGFTGRPRVEPVTQQVREAVETFSLATWLSSLVTEHGRKHPPLEIMRAMKAAYDQVNSASGCPLGCTATSDCKALRDGQGSECPARPFQLAHADAA
jgi:hypothetical protein